MTMTKMCFFLQEITAQLTAFKSLKVDHLKQAVTLGHFGDLITYLNFHILVMKLPSMGHQMC